MKLLFCLAVCAGVASAQWANLSALAPGSEVRVQTAAGKWTRGSFQKATGEAIVLNAATSQETFAQNDVKRVQLKKPGHRRRNTLIGFGAGSAAGIATGVGLDVGGDDFYRNGARIVCGAFGAILGAVAGAVWPTGGWRDVYLRDVYRAR